MRWPKLFNACVPVASAVVGMGLSIALVAAAAAECRLSPGPEKTVSRVIDGETLALDDGSRVRLSGALAPRAADAGVAAGQWPAEAAARAALDQLVAGKAVRLRFDVTRQDRHGQWLAQVYVGATGDETWVQAALLAAGHARADAAVGQRACADDLVAREGIARTTGAGLWSVPAYRIRDVTPARDIAAYAGTFQIVTGRVQAVERARDMTRLLLGADRRRAVSVSIRSNDRDVVGALGGDLQQLKGRMIEARGWIGQRPGRFAGPDLDLTLAGYVRVLADDGQVRR